MPRRARDRYASTPEGAPGDAPAQLPGARGVEAVDAWVWLRTTSSERPLTLFDYGL